MKNYDNIIADYGSLDLLLGNHAAKSGLEIYDRRQAVHDFLAETITPSYTGDDYYVAIHDPSCNLDSAMEHALIHVACSIWEEQGWRPEWDFGSTSRDMVKRLVQRFFNQGLTTLIVSGDPMVFNELGADVDVLFFENARDGTVWTYDRFKEYFGFCPDLNDLFHRLINFDENGNPPLMNPDQARTTLSSYTSIESFFVSPPPTLDSSQVERLAAQF